jgi:hypothetical protein
MNAAWCVLHARAALYYVRTPRNKNKENGGNMKSRKHLKTVLFIAGMLAVGTTMGTALLIERQGGGSQASGKSDQSRGAVGRPTHAPTPTGGIQDRGPGMPEDAVPMGNARWSPPSLVSWPHGATGGGGAYGWTAAHEWPEYYGRHTPEPGYGGVTYTIVGAGPDNTAPGRVAFNRGVESAPSVGSLFSAVPASLSPATASNPEVSAKALVAPPVPEPAEWTMLVAGLLFIGALAHRRKRQASPH